MPDREDQFDYEACQSRARIKGAIASTKRTDCKALCQSGESIIAG